MGKFSIVFVTALIGCAASPADKPHDPPELFTGSKADDGSTVSTNDPRRVHCDLIYATEAGDTSAAATIETTYGSVHGGVSAEDDQYTLYLVVNPNAGATLPLNAVIYDPDGTLRAWAMQAEPSVANDYFLALGSKIPPRTIGATTYDRMRADCTIHDP